MKLLSIALLVGYSAYGAIALVVNPAIATGSNSATTASSTTTGANLLVAVIATVATGGTMSDNKGNTWVLCGSQITNGGYFTRTYYSIPSTVGATHTVTYTLSGGFPAVMFSAWSGVNPATPCAHFGSNTGAGVNSLAPASITPSSNGALVISGEASACTIGGAQTISGGGFTTITQEAISASFGTGAWSYIIQTSAGATSPTWATSNNCLRAVTIADFAATSGGGGGGAVPRRWVVK